MTFCCAIACQYSVGACFFGGGFGFLLSPSRSAFLPPPSSGAGLGFPPLGWAAPVQTEVLRTSAPTPRSATCILPLSSFPPSCLGRLLLLSLSLSLSLSLFLLHQRAFCDRTGLEESAGKEDPFELDSNLTL